MQKMHCGKGTIIPTHALKWYTLYIPSTSFHNYYFLADDHSTGWDVAPWTLSVCGVSNGAEQHRLLWEGWASILWQRLPSALLPSLCLLQGAHSACEKSLFLLLLLSVISHMEEKNRMKYQYYLLYLFSRTSWQRWTRPGTQNTFSVQAVEACLDLKVWEAYTWISLPWKSRLANSWK